MTLFASQFPGGLVEENVDGVSTTRNGGKYSVYARARSYYEEHRNQFDLVIDEINVRPFLTPKFVKEATIIALIHQLSREGLFYELSFPLNYIVYYFLEKWWLSNYRNIPIVTVSESTKVELDEFMGFKNVQIVPEGQTVMPLPEVPTKENRPTVVYLGRLKRYKLPDHALLAFSLIKEKIPDARMWIIGDGDMRRTLERSAMSDVTFFGRVSHELKCELLSKAHLALVPSVKEGWGLVVTECNAMGTPCVAYNVSGLRDSVRSGETGLLVSENSPTGLADSAVHLLKNRELLAKLSQNALEYSRKFNWDASADVFDKIIRSVV
jgi:glycosyltransferase involved in cell wall biosynthesis